MRSFFLSFYVAGHACKPELKLINAHISHVWKLAYC